MSNALFIQKINDGLSEMASKFTGSRVFGLAQSIIRQSGDNTQLLPTIVDLSGEGTYIGVDDAAPLTIYHKSNSIAVSEKQGSGYGDNRSNKTYTYSNALVVFMDRKALGMLPDELILFIQANLPDSLKIGNYKSVNVRMQNIILNSQQVFASEYQNVDYRIPPRFSLFAINYQIESVFDKNCFATCP